MANQHEQEWEEPTRGQTTAVANIVDVSAHHHGLDAQTIGAYLVQGGDVSELNNRQRAELLAALAKHVGLDPLERPFMIIKDGKEEKIYARAACADGLSRTRGIDTEPLSVVEEEVAGAPSIVATVKATTIDIARLERLVKAGVPAEIALTAATRSKTMTGVVPLVIDELEWKTTATGKKYPEVVGSRGPTPTEAANFRMKAETKAERRAILKLVGLGISDSSEAPAGKITQLSRPAVRHARPVADPLAPRRRTALEMLAAVGVDEDDALKYVGRASADDLDGEDLTELAGLYRERQAQA